MKKTLTLTLIALCATASVQAKKAPTPDMNKEQYIAAAKKRAEAKKWPFKQATAEKQFAAIDTNKDGIATDAETKAYWSAKKAAKKAKAAK